MIPRRRFFQILTAGTAAAAGAGLYTWQVEPHWLEIVRCTLPIANLPHALHGATLAQLSDIHVGSRVADRYVLDTFERVTALEPDIVVFTGDFVSYHAGIVAHADRVYANAPRGRLATLGVLGNHDFGPGWAHPEVAAELASMLRAHGIDVLRNTVQTIEGLQIAGMDDAWGTNLKPQETVQAIDRRCAAVVLSHNPDSVDLPGWEGYTGWILAGHTHGGQCKPPFLPPPLLPVRNTRYTAGEFEISGGRRLYINRGVGHLLQVRFNVRPEVTLFELQAV